MDSNTEWCHFLWRFGVVDPEHPDWECWTGITGRLSFLRFCWLRATPARTRRRMKSSRSMFSTQAGRWDPAGWWCRNGPVKASTSSSSLGLQLPAFQWKKLWEESEWWRHRSDDIIRTVTVLCGVQNQNLRFCSCSKSGSEWFCISGGKMSLSKNKVIRNEQLMILRQRSIWLLLTEFNLWPLTWLFCIPSAFIVNQL